MSSSHIDAKLYNDYASAAVDVSDASVHYDETSGEGLLTLTRSVRDIDNNRRRRYSYSFLLPSTAATAAMPLSPPVEVNEEIKIRIASPSGRLTAVFREEGRNDSTGSGTRCVLEIWNNQHHSLERRILLQDSLHGKVVYNDASNFGTPSWDPTERFLVYPAERNVPKTTSFFQNDKKKGRDDDVIVGGENTLGIGITESWGEKYTHMKSPLLDLFCVDTITGNAGQVTNVPGTKTSESGNIDISTNEGGYVLGQPVFSPDGKSIVYTGWDAGGGNDMPKRLGLIYCQQRPTKIYASPVEQLMIQLSKSSDLQQTATNGIDTNKDDTEIDMEKDADYRCLTSGYRIAFSPRFGPTRSSKNGSNNLLVFVGSKEGFDSHAGNLALYAIDWNDTIGSTATKIRVLVDHVSHPMETGAQVEDIGFPGLYMGQLPSPQCFVAPDCLLVTTYWGSTQKIVRIFVGENDGNDNNARCELLNIHNGGKNDDLHKVNDNCSQQLLCVAPDGGIVVCSKSPNEPGVLSYIPASAFASNKINAPKQEGADEEEKSGNNKSGCGILDLEAQVLPKMTSIASSGCSGVLPIVKHGITYEVLTMEDDITTENTNSNAEDEVNSHDTTKQAPIQCILMLPEGVTKPPLVVVPHGGPHSVMLTTYVPGYSYLCGSGYAILHVNFRGSLGFGRAAVEGLLKNIGDTDVKDVVFATRSVIASGKVDGEKIAVCGGSHGGFLAAHLTARHPELFNGAAALRNPVTNIATMVTATDIPDWCYVECLGHYPNQNRFCAPTEKELRTMYEKSPVAFGTSNVIAPTLVALGLSDKRVPPSQGYEWYHAVRSSDKNIPCKLLAYENDDHAIDRVASEADHWINIKRWFDEHLDF